jgi:hypothetical protein
MISLVKFLNAKVKNIYDKEEKWIQKKK